MENYDSPLKKYSRQPKLYIDLPSKGEGYPEGSLLKTEELEVYSMTANDEIAVKVPDGLFSGKATISIIQNCIPAIKDASYVTNRDIDYLLAAIRIASYGDSISITKKCTECENEDTFAFPLQTLLDHLSTAEFLKEIRVNDFVFRLRPLYYKEIIHNQQESIKLRRYLNQVLDTIDDANERAEKIEEVSHQINEQTKNVICSIITEVVTPEGQSETNQMFIRDFVLNNEGVYFNELQKIYSKNNEKLSVPSSKVSCSECGAEQQIRPVLDYSSFFLKP